MAGKKQFEEAQALDRALVAFWQAGYQATSYTDLEAATGLNKSSLYNAFGAKSELYKKCLQRFETAYEQPLLEHLQQGKLRDVLAAYFEGLFKHFADTTIPCGSLATMDALANGSRSGADAQWVQSQMDRLRVLLQTRFERAIHDGELAKNTDTNALACLFVVLSRGLAVLHHNDAEIQILRSALSSSMAILDAPPRKTRAPAAQNG